MAKLDKFADYCDELTTTSMDSTSILKGLYDFGKKAFALTALEFWTYRICDTKSIISLLEGYVGNGKPQSMGTIKALVKNVPYEDIMQQPIVFEILRNKNIVAAFVKISKDHNGLVLFSLESFEGGVIEELCQSNVSLWHTLHVAFLLRDIEKAHADLDQERGVAKGIIDSSLDAIIASDVRGVIKMVNPETEAMFGYEREELIGQNVKVLMTHGNAVDHDRYMSDYVVSGNAKIIGTGREVVAKHKDGHEFPAFLSLANFSIGGERHFAASIHDLTTRNQALLELGQARSETQQYFETAATPILVLDVEGGIRLLNQAASDLLEVSLATVVGDHFFKKFIPDWPLSGLYHDFEMLIDEGVETNHRINQEVRGLTGDKKDVEWRLAPLIEKDLKGNDEVKSVILSGIDMTEIKRAEEELLQSQKLQALGLLTGGIAHDFNNLLAVIQGNVNLLLEDLAEIDSPLKGELTESANAISEATKRGVALTSRLLLFSRKKNMQSEEVNVGQLIIGLEELLKRSLGEKMTLDIYIDDNAVGRNVFINPAELENALLNLAINARDAMQAEGVLEISLEKVAVGADKMGVPNQLAEGDYLLIEVIDEGTGIPEEILDKIFDPFFTTKSVEEGNGLGLSMVFGLAKQAGGAVSVATADGEGTTMRLWLPECPTLFEAKIDEMGEAALKHHGDANLLFVEDEANVRRTLTRNFERAGYKVKAFEDAVLARDAIKSGEEFDLLVTDMILPNGMSGNDLRHFVHDTLSPEKPVIIISGYSKELDQLLSEQHATMKVLEKPFDMVKIYDLFDEMLGNDE